MSHSKIDRSTLIPIVLTLPEFSSGRAEDIRAALFNAGLEQFRDQVDLTSGIPRTKIGAILEKLELYNEPLPSYPDYYPLGLFLKYMLSIGDLKPSHAEYVAQLIVENQLTSNKEFLNQLRDKYQKLALLKTLMVKPKSKRPTAKKTSNIQTLDSKLKPGKNRPPRPPIPTTPLQRLVEENSDALMKITELRHVLANLYPDNESIRRIIYDSGLNLAQISLYSTPVNNWQAILLEAQKSNQLNVLLNVVKREYGANPAFQTAYDRYYEIVQTTNPAMQKAQKLNWPPVWRTEQQQTIVSIDNWWKSVPLEFNPFGPEQAERDPDLPKRGVYPDVLPHRLSGRRTTIIYGANGSGKTACARLLAYSCIYPESSPLEAKTYPVLHTIAFQADVEQSKTDFSRFFAYVLADSLVPFFARNASQFLSLQESAKLAIALCLLHGFGSIDEMNTQLYLSGTKDSEECKQLLAEIDSLLRNQTPPRFNPKKWLEIFSEARPHAFEQTYLIIDVGIKDGQEVTVLASYLQSLIDYWMAFEVSNVYLKLLLPDSVQQHLRIPGDIVRGKLEWSEQKLYEMLHYRLRNQKGRRVDFNELFDQEAKLVNPAKLLVEAAKGSPRRLIRIGNRLLEEHIQQNPVPVELSYHSLMAAITYVANE